VVILKPSSGGVNHALDRADGAPLAGGAAEKMNRRDRGDRRGGVMKGCLINFNVKLLKEGIRRIVNEYAE